jgi:hypothetical protein
MVLEVINRRAELEERIKALEEERDNLQVEIAALKLKAIAELEAKSLELEVEVAKLREKKRKLAGETEDATASAERSEELTGIQTDAPITTEELPPVPA